jgi:hypothetical protein
MRRNPHEIYNSTKAAKRLTGQMRLGRNQSESQEQGPTLKKETAQATSECKKIIPPSLKTTTDT